MYKSTMRRIRKTAFSIIFILVAMIVASGILGVYFSVREGERSHSPERDFAAQFYGFKEIKGDAVLPSFSIYDMEGNVHDAAALSHTGVTLVNLWAVWCAPCIKEIPGLLALDKRMKDERRPFQVVFISMDYPSGPDEMKRLIEKFGLSGLKTYYTQDQTLWTKLEVKALPTSILLSPDGRIQYRMTGDTDWGGPVSTRFLNHFLRQNGAEG